MPMPVRSAAGMTNREASMCQNKVRGGKGPKFLTVRQVADELGISDRGGWRLVDDSDGPPEIPSHMFGSSRRVSREDLDAYIARSRRGSNKPPAETDDDDEPERK